MHTRLVGLLKILTISIFLSMLPKVVLADCFDCCDQYRVLSTPPNVYYAGVTYSQSKVKRRGEWHRFFVSNYAGTGFYFGRVICDLFSIELGYEWNIDKPKSFEVPVGSSVLGVTNFGTPFIPIGTPGLIGPPPLPDAIAPGTVTVNSKVRFKTGYLDINNYVPIFLDNVCLNWLFKPNLILSLGVANTRPKFHIIATPRSTYPIDEINLVQAKSKAVLRLGLGIQGYFYENFGLRILGRWFNTATLRGRGGIAGLPANRVIFSNTWSIHIGVYFSFRDPLEYY